MSKETGGPAFPGKNTENITPMNYHGPIIERDVFYQGMTLRDYFAGQAMIGLIEKSSPCREGQAVTAALISRVRGLCHNEINAGSSSPLVVASLELCAAMERQTEAVEKYLVNCDAILASMEGKAP